MVNIANITPPRVPLTDPRTGLIAREWYLFLLSLFNQTGQSTNSLVDIQKGPPAASVDDITAAIDRAISFLDPVPGTSELQASLENLQQELRLLPRPELGTMAQLQQSNLPWVTFDTTPQSVPVTTTGTLYWDTADNTKTLNLVMEDTGDILQRIGQESYYRVRADSTITKGQVVMFTGTLGASGGLKAAPATGLTATQNEYIMGISTQDIATNNWGYITWFGEIRKVNATGSLYGETWVDGEILYYNPSVPGGLTKTVPTAPNPKVIVAAVVHAATNGVLFVRPTFGSALGATDSNVQITGLANNDLLQYKSATMRWENVPASTLPVGTATNLAGGTANQIPYQTAPGTTSFITAPTVANTFLNWSGSAFQWSLNPLGTVTSVNVSGGTTGLTFSGGPITTSGTITMSGTLDVDNGGTGATTLTGLVKGNGTAAFTAAVAGVDYAGVSNSNTFTANQIISVSDNTNAALRITQTGTGDVIRIEDSTNPDATPFVINASGQVLRGSSTDYQAPNYAGSQLSPFIQTSGTSSSASGLAFFNWSSSTSSGAPVLIAKSKSGTIGTPGIVAADDDIGEVTFSGDDGVKFVSAATIRAEVDGTPGVDDMPGRLLFLTTADGASVPTERMRINNAGRVGVGTSAPDALLSVNGIASFGAGAAATPSVAAFGDLNTGMWFPAADTVAWSTGGSEQARITSAGNVGIGTTTPACALDVTGGIQTSRTNVTSPAATDGNVFSGTYTPTLTNVTNIAASTAFSCQYIRVGRVITVSGRVDIDPTATGRIVMEMSLPIASNFTATTNLGGTFSAVNVTATSSGGIRGETTNDRAYFDGVVGDAANRAYYFTFTYSVL